MSNLEALKQPFDPADIELRVGATTKDNTKGQALPYITSRAVMDRLDSVVGPENWRDEYQPGPSGGVVCGISIRVGDIWITKWDGAENSQFEAVKGGLSDAFKRAAVKWGIGRYLYALTAPWVPITQRGKSSYITDEADAKRRIFGGQVTPAGNRPTGNGSQPQGRNFRTFDGLLNQLHKDFGLTKDEAKARLKEAGYTSFKVSESGAMYNAVMLALEPENA